MNPQTRDELIELGAGQPPSPLIAWAWELLAATKTTESRLQTRGVTGAQLAGLRDLVGIVEKRQQELGDACVLPPQAVALAQRIREEAAGYWREVRQIVRAEFSTQPDLLARFRTGVRTGLLLGNLTRELEAALPLLREHASALAPLGATPAFIERGELLVARLKEAKRQLDDACRALPSNVIEHCYHKGLLYDLCRKLVRVGRLAFMLDPQQASAFNFTGVRASRGISTRPRMKKAGISG